MRRRLGIDWRRVATILRARNEGDVIRCPSCRAEGTVPYIAEHVLTTHRHTPIGKTLARVIVQQARSDA